MIINGEYIEKISDEELYIIEQMTYLDEMVAEKAGANNFFLRSMQTIIEIRLLKEFWMFSMTKP